MTSSTISRTSPHDDIAVPAHRHPRIAVVGARGLLLEAIVSVVAALGMVATTRSIPLDPIDRVGQVSGLSGVLLHFTLAVFVLALVVVVDHAVPRWAPRHLSRLVWPALAGLATGAFAAGIMLALRGTEWPLNGPNGDVNVVATWADQLQHGGSVEPGYPPLFIYLLSYVSRLTDQPSIYAMKDAQIVGTALYGPIAYLAWRLIVPPMWALIIGIVGILPFLDPNKPFTLISLLVMVPLLCCFVGKLRRVACMSRRTIGLTAGVLGVALAVCLLVYSGWFLWYALGTGAAILLAFPWRTARGKGALFVGVGAVAFFATASWYLLPMVGQAPAPDTYFYFDTNTEPAFIAMWRGDYPGPVGVWPPPGELGNVGLFTIGLVAAAASAIWSGGRRSVVWVLALSMAGAWLMRFLVASKMWETKQVNLYPRTTMVILGCLLFLALYSAYLRFGPRTRDDLMTTSQRFAVLVATAILFGSAASASADRYMPRQDGSVGQFAYRAHATALLDGSCPENPAPECVPTGATP